MERRQKDAAAELVAFECKPLHHILPMRGFHAALFMAGIMRILEKMSWGGVRELQATIPCSAHGSCLGQTA
jgi:hypothetical protein